MLITKSPLLTLRQAADRCGVKRPTVKFWSDVEGLNTIRADDGSLHVREAELHRWLAERAERRQRRADRAARRRQEAAARRERWLAEIAERHGLVRAA